MNLTAVRAVFAFLKIYGPILEELGVDLTRLYQFVEQHRTHPGLTDAERAEMKSIIDEDPTTIGMTGTPVGDVPPPVTGPPPVQGFPYFQVLDSDPDDSKLVAGDTVWGNANGKFFVMQHGIGIPMDSTWTKVRVIG